MQAQRPRRGRPTVAERIFGSASKTAELIWESGGNLNTKRSTADYIYCTAALRIILEAASEIPFIETICRMDGENKWYSRSILSQLGRMSMQDGYSDDDVIAITKVAAMARHENCTVKQIERYIRNCRKTDKW